MATLALPPVTTVVNDAARGISAVSVRSEATGASEDREASALSRETRTPGRYVLTFSIPGNSGAVRVPVCAGRGAVSIDGTEVALAPGPAVLPLKPLPAAADHVLVVHLQVSGYEKRIACGEPVVAGVVAHASPATGELAAFDFSSAHAAAGGGHAVVYIPPGHDMTAPGALLVGLHPWNGTMWTYAAYAELLDEAAKRDVVLLFPSGLGNSLYTAPAEDEAMRAIAAASALVPIDPARMSIWGASMGGAGATTIGFHHPDEFAHITSFFGDSDYDIRTYVHSILHDQDGAHRVNALDVVENVRNVPVWLIHGTADKVSSIVQSERLDAALKKRHFTERFDRVEGRGHEGGVVALFIREVVDHAATEKAQVHPSHVTYTSVRPEDLGAYGVHLTKRTPSKDAFVDVERTASGTVGRIRIHHADNVSKIVFDSGALGAVPGANEPVQKDTSVPPVDVASPP